MKLEKECRYNNLDSTKCKLSYESVNTCPICKAKIAPVFIAGSINNSKYASIFNFCKNCENTFIAKYSISKLPKSSISMSYYQAKEWISSEPNSFSKYDFDKKLVDISPQFDKIYNQALAAESAKLDEIAGLGYRKALEFLIKDFSIHEKPDEAEKIKSISLSECIKTYIDAENITTLAERSAWLGNDEAHYVQKLDDRDINDMKTFINAIVYFIEMTLVTEDAASIRPKKKL